MDDLRQEVAGLKARMRLMTLSMIGALTIAVMAGGGADAVAKNLVAAAPAWTVSTKNLAGSATPLRLTITGDEDVARIQVSNANIELAQQGTAPVSPAAGMLWYDNANAKLKFYNGTAWVDTSGGGGGGGGASGVSGRLRWISTSTVRLEQYAGDLVTINNQSVSIGSAGKDVTTTTNNVITATGTDSGALPVLNTTYHVYLSNAAATYAPSSLRLSTTAPQQVSGVQYLGTSGNALQWRFIGWVRTNASNQFEDSMSKRFVINYYNRRPLPLRVVETSVTWWASPVTGWRRFNGTSTNRVELLSNGEDAVHLSFAANAASSGSSGTNVILGIGVDVAGDGTPPDAASSIYPGAIGQAAGNRPSAVAVFTGVPSTGYHYLQLLEYTDWATYTTWYGTNGAGKAPGASGWVMG